MGSHPATLGKLIREGHITENPSNQMSSHLLHDKPKVGNES